MEGWKESIELFLRTWKGKSHILGAILTGSYAIGLETKDSDINIHIITDNKTSWKERGYVTVNEYHISYFATPFKQILRHLDQDRYLGRKVDATAFSRGVILFDKTGVVKELKDHAKKEMEEPLPELEKSHVELYKASLHDGFIKLKSAYHDRTVGFSYAYHLYLDSIISIYARFLGCDLPHHEKLGAYLTDRAFQQRYGVKSLPDARFKTLFREALEQQAKTKQLDSARKLRNYVIRKMGGFDTNNWYVRDRID
ncbi:MAG: nucleotidyltransferase domain-containing protein [Nanoarchaeota archaeon]